MTATTPPPLAADLTDGLKRLKMAGMRRLAPELLITAKTQRWNPEEFLRTLIEAEITARNASNARTRRRQACFPRAGPAAMLPGDRPGPFWRVSTVMAPCAETLDHLVAASRARA